MVSGYVLIGGAYGHKDYLSCSWMLPFGMQPLNRLISVVSLRHVSLEPALVHSQPLESIFRRRSTVRFHMRAAGCTLSASLPGFEPGLVNVRMKSVL